MAAHTPTPARTPRPPGRGAQAAPGPAPTAAPPAGRVPRPVKVRATRLGYYGERRRRPGDVFLVTDEAHVSTRWMVRVPAATPESVTTVPEALRREHAALVAGVTPPLDPTGDLHDPVAEDGPATPDPSNPLGV